MLVSPQIFPERPVLEWTKCFRSLYETQDLCRRPEEFWNATMAHFSSIGESIRKNHYPDLLRYSAHSFCWMCSFVQRLNDLEDPIFSYDSSLSEIVFFKYPKQCGHCFSSSCTCSPAERESIKDKTFNYKKLLEKYSKGKGGLCVYTLRHWLALFRNIYNRNIKLQTMESIGFHLLEESGEAAKAIRLLIQFRGLPNANIPGIDEKFFQTTNSIEGIVGQYYSCINDLKAFFSVKHESEVITSLSKSSSSKDPIIIKAKYVKAKLDLICELADSFSWFCNVLLKLREITDNLCNDCVGENNWDIEETLVREYQAFDLHKPILCYACKLKKCECTFFHERAIFVP
jgi:hypothetical protein